MDNFSSTPKRRKVFIVLANRWHCFLSHSLNEVEEAEKFLSVHLHPVSCEGRKASRNKVVSTCRYAPGTLLSHFKYFAHEES
ncbi:hypothetical protein TNCV_1589691 [Trichonephila clavipes]|uniref:Uncharacterized protein n=1 Tax=Trichonephila clavipes TaxID=2585209 RepID=A0A8X6UZN6_TRICX|nr:hypothetical protein TNCV_1589691 [Trichonephila clavipes]